MTDDRTKDGPSTALTKSLGGSDLTSGLATVADIGLDTAVAAAHGVPILGAILGLAKAGREVRQTLQFNKVVRFLQGVSSASAKARAEFTAKLADELKMEEFGENLLLLLDRLDDTTKPAIIGRVVAAHIDGHIEYDVAMRLCAMVSRCYSTDLKLLRSFKPGMQRGREEQAAMLAADGLLINVGIDGNAYAEVEMVAIIYAMSDYGRLLLQYGLKP